MKTAIGPAWRWGVALAAALAAHGLAAAWLWPRSPQPVEAGAAPAAILIDLPAPSAAAAPAPPQTPVPEPPSPAAPTPPRPPEPAPPPRRTESPRAVTPPAPARPTPEAAPAASAREATPETPAPGEADAAEPSPESARPSPSAAVAADAAAAASAPQRGSAHGRPAAEVAWQSRLLGHLEGFRRYPVRALRQRQEGVTYLRFSVDRQGRVGAVQLERSSGSALLDAEALDVVRRAEPVPAPPREIEGDPVEVVVPVQFKLRRR